MVAAVESESARAAREALERRELRVREAEAKGTAEKLDQWPVPIGDSLVLFRLVIDVLESGIILPNSEDISERCFYRVLAVGDGCERGLKKGDLVIATGHAGYEMRISRVPLFLVCEEDVKARIVKVGEEELQRFLNDPTNATVPEGV